MTTVRECNIPEDLYYWMAEHVWVRLEPDGTLTVGMTDAAQSLAGSIINATPKGVGRGVKKGKSTGTVESGKWVGPIKSPVSGEIIALNEALAKNPKLLNQDPYGKGWFVRIQPDNWDTDKTSLDTGSAAVEKYLAFLKQEGIECKSWD